MTLELETPLDHAHADMTRSDEARLNFYGVLADTPMFLFLEPEEATSEDTVTPHLFDVDGRSVALAFDSETRLADFAGQAAHYLEVPGRILVQMLSEQKIGLGVNLDVAPSSIMLDADALTWLTETLANDIDAPQVTDLTEIGAPGAIPPALLDALAARLSSCGGLAECAVLARAKRSNGAQAHVLGIIGASERAELAMARSVSEALTFSGIEAGFIDVLFARSNSPMAERLLRVGMRFDIPEPAQEASVSVLAPGMDPEKPPRLR